MSPVLQPRSAGKILNSSSTSAGPGYHPVSPQRVSMNDRILYLLSCDGAVDDWDGRRVRKEGRAEKVEKASAGG